jgi:hypothetical protein
MRKLMSRKLISVIKVKAVSDGAGYDPSVLVTLGAVPSRPDRLSIGRRLSVYVG